jgi:hypothetical protein
MRSTPTLFAAPVKIGCTKQHTGSKISQLHTSTTIKWETCQVGAVEFSCTKHTSFTLTKRWRLTNDSQDGKSVRSVKTIYKRYICTVFLARKYTVIYSVHIWFWPTQKTTLVLQQNKGFKVGSNAGGVFSSRYPIGPRGNASFSTTNKYVYGLFSWLVVQIRPILFTGFYFCSCLLPII